MSLRVIEGGVRPGDPAPIVWNRRPLREADRRALVIRDARGTRDNCDLAWDDGQDTLCGIRSLSLPAGAACLAAWVEGARAEGLQVRDERQVNPLTEGSTSLVQEFELSVRARESKRDHEPLPAGSLFDGVTRNTRDLF